MSVVRKNPDAPSSAPRRSAVTVCLAVAVLGSTDLIAYVALQGASSGTRVGIMASITPIAVALTAAVRRIIG